jgi:molybdopterin-guanine dinucleotide biosynthesis protein B
VHELKTRVIAVVGSKKSGKTTTIENLTRELTKRGYNVAAVKHVSEQDFTIDTPEKDTWKFAQSGAKTIISVAANEIATLEKIPLESVSLKTLLKKCRGNHVVFVEGLKKLVATKKNVSKIVIVKSRKETMKALESFKPILAFSGPYSTEALNLKIQYVDAVKNPVKLADIIENKLLKK